MHVGAYAPCRYASGGIRSAAAALWANDPENMPAAAEPAVVPQVRERPMTARRASCARARQSAPGREGVLICNDRAAQFAHRRRPHHTLHALMLAIAGDRAAAA